MHCKWVLPLLLTVAASAAAGDPIQSLASIETAVRGYVESTLGDDPDREISLGRLDPRLRLAACEDRLVVALAAGQGGGDGNRAEVRCNGQRPWSIYVVVNVMRHAQVVVATHALARGAVISANDVTLTRRAITDRRMDFLTDTTQAIGQIASRAIGAEQVLGTTNVKLPHLVKRGDDVTLASVGGGISVRVRGKAMVDGALGDHITVRNANSARVVEGVVSAAGVVLVTAAVAL